MIPLTLVLQKLVHALWAMVTPQQSSGLVKKLPQPNMGLTYPIYHQQRMLLM